jgi:hypothetical protein
MLMNDYAGIMKAFLPRGEPYQRRFDCCILCLVAEHAAAHDMPHWSTILFSSFQGDSKVYIDPRVYEKGAPVWHVVSSFVICGKK